MAAFDPLARLQRLEQQLDAFEALHGDELRELQRRLEAYQRLQEDEVRLLHEEIADLRSALAGAERSTSTEPPPCAAPVRREPGSPAEGAAPSATASGQAAPPASPQDEARVTEQAVEEAVETSLQQTVSRRELFGGHRPSGDQPRVVGDDPAEESRPGR